MFWNFAFYDVTGVRLHQITMLFLFSMFLPALPSTIHLLAPFLFNWLCNCFRIILYNILHRILTLNHIFFRWIICLLLNICIYTLHIHLVKMIWRIPIFIWFLTCRRCRRVILSIILAFSLIFSRWRYLSLWKRCSRFDP